MHTYELILAESYIEFFDSLKFYIILYSHESSIKNSCLKFLKNIISIKLIFNNLFFYQICILLYIKLQWLINIRSYNFIS